MARKPDFVRTQFRIPPGLNEKIEEFADARNLSKNQAMIVLIENGLKIEWADGALSDKEREWFRLYLKDQADLIKKYETQISKSR